MDQVRERPSPGHRRRRGPQDPKRYVGNGAGLLASTLQGVTEPVAQPDIKVADRNPAVQPWRWGAPAARSRGGATAGAGASRAAIPLVRFTGLKATRGAGAPVLLNDHARARARALL